MGVLSLVDKHYERNSQFERDVVRCEMAKVSLRESEVRAEATRLQWEILNKRVGTDGESEAGDE